MERDSPAGVRYRPAGRRAHFLVDVEKRAFGDSLQFIAGPADLDGKKQPQRLHHRSRKAHGRTAAGGHAPGKGLADCTCIVAGVKDTPEKALSAEGTLALALVPTLNDSSPLWLFGPPRLTYLKRGDLERDGDRHRRGPGGRHRSRVRRRLGSRRPAVDRHPDLRGRDEHPSSP